MLDFKGQMFKPISRQTWHEMGQNLGLDWPNAFEIVQLICGYVEPLNYVHSTASQVPKEIGI
jgi:hypothetical protein